MLYHKSRQTPQGGFHMYNDENNYYRYSAGDSEEHKPYMRETVRPASDTPPVTPVTPVTSAPKKKKKNKTQELPVSKEETNDNTTSDVNLEELMNMLK